jgi:hypothetical protein
MPKGRQARQQQHHNNSSGPVFNPNFRPHQQGYNMPNSRYAGNSRGNFNNMYNSPAMYGAGNYNMAAAAAAAAAYYGNQGSYNNMYGGSNMRQQQQQQQQQQSHHHRQGKPRKLNRFLVSILNKI